jgi:hypothetical protein
MLAIRLSLACALSTVLLGIVVANAINDAKPAMTAEPERWVTIVFKNPH